MATVIPGVSGAGLFCNGSNPTLDNCMITDNDSSCVDGGGGGIYFSGISPGDSARADRLHHHR